MTKVLRKIDNSYINISSYFLQDCYEHLKRFELCRSYVELFQKRTWEVKLFIDLRMGYESILKAILIFCLYKNNSKQIILTTLKRTYKHNINLLEFDLKKSNLVPRRIKKIITLFGDEKWDSLPMDLRYATNMYDFYSAKKNLYYDTLRDEFWIKNLYRKTKCLRSLLLHRFSCLPITYRIRKPYQ